MQNPLTQTTGQVMVDGFLKNPFMRGALFFVAWFLHLIAILGSKKNGLDAGLGTIAGFTVVWLFFEFLHRRNPAWKLKLPKNLWIAVGINSAAVTIIELVYVSANQITFWTGMVASTVFITVFCLVVMAVMRGLDELASKV